MRRSCDACGVEYEAKRPNSRYHSPACRKRGIRSGIATPPSKPERPVPDESTQLVTPAVLAELKTAGVENSAAGRVALALALRLDSPSVDTGSALASVARQLLEAMRTATADVEPASASPLDELRKRRESRGA